MASIENVIKFLKSIKEHDNVVIIFHNDGDGICSAVLLKKILPCEPLLISQPMPTDKNLINKISTTVPDKIIILDIAIDQQPDVVKKINRLSPLLIIDHHKINKNLNNRRIIHYNPRFENPDIYQSASYVVYKICKKIKPEIEKYLWLAGIGIVSDYSLEDSQDVVEEIKRKYEIEDIRNSILSKFNEMIISVKATKDLTSEEIANLFDQMEEPKDLEKFKNGQKMINAYKKMETEIDAIMVDVDRAERYKNVIIYHLKSNYNLRSYIATKISERFPNKIIIVYQKFGNKIKVSARSQEGFDIDEILKKAASGLDAIAGGHASAGGATINKKDWESFKENLIKIAENSLFLS